MDKILCTLKVLKPCHRWVLSLAFGIWPLRCFNKRKADLTRRADFFKPGLGPSLSSTTGNTTVWQFNVSVLLRGIINHIYVDSPQGRHCSRWIDGSRCEKCVRLVSGAGMCSVPGEDGLLVERVLPGGAVEAWNRQCPGDFREIRPGDREPGLVCILTNGQ